MDDASFVERIRQSLIIVRVFALASLIALPFAMSYGLAPAYYLATAIPVGVLWLASMLYGWRKRSDVWGGVSLLVVFAGQTMARELVRPEPWSYFTQWFSLVILIAWGVPSIFRARVIRFCRLEKSATATQSF